MLLTHRFHLPSRATLGAVSLGAATSASVAALCLGVDASVPDVETPGAPRPAHVTETESWTEWEVRCLRAPERHPHDRPRNCTRSYQARGQAPLTPGLTP
jgi:hypothetical protein